ncbi:MAG: class I SAM-dependent methyltransferase [Elusimicrobiota bacterium]
MRRRRPPRPEHPGRRDTSWQEASGWYGKSVGEKGHHYHRSVVIPGVLKLLDIRHAASASLLDLGCGQGVLSRALPSGVDYWGVDASPALIEQARELGGRGQFLCADATANLPLEKSDFTHAALILALQNMSDAGKAVNNAARRLRPGGRAVAVVNHPCFRVPKQSFWGVDKTTNMQYRKLQRYLSPQRVSIRIHPSRREKSPIAWTFHEPLAGVCKWFSDAGLLIERLEEWVSDKRSTGPQARREDIARMEFPLFLALSALKPG